MHLHGIFFESLYNVGGWYSMYTMTDFFCGIGGMSLGFLHNDITPIAAYDFDENCIKTYNKNVSTVGNVCDISTLHAVDITPSDIWTFGFPCQDLSIAGKQRGFVLHCNNCGNTYTVSPSDTNVCCPVCKSSSYSTISRSGMFFEIMRLLNEVKALDYYKLPKVLLAENVNGVIPYLSIIHQEFKKHGYITAWRAYNSKYFGVPQNRERVFIVGIRQDLVSEFNIFKSSKSFKFPPEQHEYVPCLQSVLDSNVDLKYYVSAQKCKAILSQESILPLYTTDGSYPISTPDMTTKVQHGLRIKDKSDCCFTLTAMLPHGVLEISDIARYTGLCDTKNTAKTLRVGGQGSLDKSHNYQHIIGCLEDLDTIETIASKPTFILNNRVYFIRRLTPTECGRLQGFPVDDEWVQVVSDTQAYKQFGNAVTVPVIDAIANNIHKFLQANDAK